jgi:hypothetical protein
VYLLGLPSLLLYRRLLSGQLLLQLVYVRLLLAHLRGEREKEREMNREFEKERAKRGAHRGRVVAREVPERSHRPQW